MSLPLKELRFGISGSTHAALEARAVAGDRDILGIARDLLDEWARREHTAYTVYARRIIANGSQAELPGFGLEDTVGRRNRAEDAGLSRHEPARKPR